MKKIGKLVVMLSLIAMAPSFTGKPSKPNFAKKINAAAKGGKADAPASSSKNTVEPPTKGRKIDTPAVATKKAVKDDSSWFQGLERHVWFVNNASNCTDTPDGSFHCPFLTLEEASNASSENDIIYVFAGDKPYVRVVDDYDYDYGYDYDYSPPIFYPVVTGNDKPVVTLKNGVTLLGSGCALKIGEKTIPALTDRHPTILVTDNYAAVALNNRNLVAGFKIRGDLLKKSKQDKTVGFGIVNAVVLDQAIGIPTTAATSKKVNDTFNRVIPTSGVGGSCDISRNTFENLNIAIQLRINGWSSIDICTNKFVNDQFGVILGTNDGTTAHIKKNLFEGVYQGVVSQKAEDFFGTLPVAGSLKETLAKTHTLGCSLLMESSDDSPICKGAELFVEDNCFKGPSIPRKKGSAIFELVPTAFTVRSGAKTVKFCNNDVSDFTSGETGCPGLNSNIESYGAGFKIALGIRDAAIPGSLVEICENKFDRVDINGLGLANAKTIVKKNKFSQGLTGLGMVSFGGLIAVVEENNFCDNKCTGFEMSLGLSNQDRAERPAVVNPSCLQLAGNHHKNNKIDFELINSIGCPSLFKVAAPNPLFGAKSLSRANYEGLVIILDQNGDRNENAVEFVHFCPGCDNSK